MRTSLRPSRKAQLVFYCHENEAGTAAIMEGFGKDFPKIKTSYVRAQTGALYNKIVSERSAGRFDVDVLQLSDVAPAVDFEKRGGYEVYTGPYMDAYKKDYLSATAGAYFWTGVTFAGLAYNKTQGDGRGSPKTYQDINNPRFRNKISCKISSSGIQYVQWYLLRQIYGNDFWKEFAKQRPRAFDSRVQLFDRLAKGDDDMTALAEYSAYVLYKQRGADVEFVGPPEGLVATPLIVGAVNKAPHPEAAKLFVDWAMSPRGQKYYQDHPNLYYGSLTNDPPADADRAEALRLQADLSEGLGRLRQDARGVQQGMERDAGAVSVARGHPSRRVAVSAFTRVCTRYGDAPQDEVRIC